MGIKSMTGFGSASAENDHISVKTEIKSLNGKFLEINMRLPRSYSSKEIEIRKMISTEMERGSVNLFVTVENKNINPQQYRINRELAKYYFDEISELAFELGANLSDTLLKVIDMPDVLSVKEEDISMEDNWKLIAGACNDAMQRLKSFREQEGMYLGKEMEACVLEIKSQIDVVQQLEGERMSTIRERIHNNLEEVMGIQNIDKMRFEQELVFFVERLDIAEEKTRLRNHCNYFLENLYKPSAGKKLGFISQEMGREINTMGSKSYHFGIQQAVVKMKEELEKIKEQVLNIL